MKFLRSLVKMAVESAVTNLTLSSMTKAGEAIGELIGRKINPLWTELQKNQGDEDDEETDEEGEDGSDTGP